MIGEQYRRDVYGTRPKSALFRALPKSTASSFRATESGSVIFEGRIGLAYICNVAHSEREIDFNLGPKAIQFGRLYLARVKIRHLKKGTPHAGSYRDVAYILGA